MRGTAATGKVDGAAAAMGEHQQVKEYSFDTTGGLYGWEPEESESGGRLGRVVMHVFNRLAKVPAAPNDVQNGMWVCAAHAR